jgi:hypothetical protein
MKGGKCILRLVRVCNFRMEQQLKMAKELCVPSVSCMLSLLLQQTDPTTVTTAIPARPPWLQAQHAPTESAHRAGPLLSARLAYLPS